MNKIDSPQAIIDSVNEYGILPFWTEEGFSAWQMSAVGFLKLWYMREKAVNSLKVAYGKFVNKKATFVSLQALPYLCALRRDGYDFDSLSDEGRAPRREIDVMNNINGLTAQYKLKKSLEIKGFDGVVTSLQNKTYLCLTFCNGSAMLCTPEDLFGADFVRSAYSLSPDECAKKLIELCPGINNFPEKERQKMLSVAI